MRASSEDLRARLACPRCRAPLRLGPSSEELECAGCTQHFPVVDGIPHLFVGVPHRRAGASVAAHYDGIAPHYDDAIPAHVAEHYRTKRLHFVRSILSEGAILDVGCGTGVLAAALVRAGFTVAGLDASPGMLLQLAQRCSATAVAGFSDRLPFADRSFDGALTVATLHHIAGPEQVAATIAEMVRVVRPGGPVILWDHNPDNPYWPILMRRVPQDTGEERLIPMREIVASLRASSVRTIRVHRMGLVPDFVPLSLLPLAQAVERVFEGVPGLRRWAAHNVVVGIRP